MVICSYEGALCDMKAQAAEYVPYIDGCYPNVISTPGRPDLSESFKNIVLSYVPFIKEEVNTALVSAFGNYTYNNINVILL